MRYLFGYIIQCLLLTVVVLFSTNLSGQQPDSTLKPFHIAGTITATQNGISLIPSFSLNKPAAMFDFNIGGKHLAFEPLLRFGMNGKPWSFVLWWRYRFNTMKRFNMSIGAHPSFVFREIVDSGNGYKDAMQVSRYFAMDFTPTWRIGKNIFAGVYYLTSRGLDKTSVAYTHFITLNMNFARIGLSKDLYFRFAPQVYYLNMGGRTGFYLTHTLTLLHQRFPLSIQTIMNKAIETEIAAKPFVWNASLLYQFRKDLTRQTR